MLSPRGQLAQVSYTMICSLLFSRKESCILFLECQRESKEFKIQLVALSKRIFFSPASFEQ